MDNCKVNLSLYNNSWFDPVAIYVKRFIWYFVNVLFLLNPLNPFSCLKVWIDNLVKVVIGKNVCISQGAMLLCGNHNYKKQTFDLMVASIKLEDGCWIGAKSIVCPGTTLHSHSMLGLLSVANHDLESYSVYQGNPAKKVRNRIIN